MDTYAPHYDPVVLRRAFHLGIAIEFIPARLTWLMQPLDTHVFRRFKSYLRKVIETSTVAQAGVKLGKVAWIALGCEAVQCILEDNNWSLAFMDNGYGGQQKRLSKAILSELKEVGVPESSAARPTLEMVQLCFPKGRGKGRIPELFQPYPEDLAALAVPALHPPDMYVPPIGGLDASSAGGAPPAHILPHEASSAALTVCTRHRIACKRTVSGGY